MFISKVYYYIHSELEIIFKSLFHLPLDYLGFAVNGLSTGVDYYEIGMLTLFYTMLH